MAGEPEVYLSSAEGSLETDSDPSQEPITLAEVKSFLRIDSNSEDTLITALITSVRQFCEGYCRRAFVFTDFTLYRDVAPNGNSIELPRGKLEEIIAVEYIDVSGNQVTFPQTCYHSDNKKGTGRVKLKAGYSWPSVKDQPNAFWVKFRAGYGADHTQVPQAVKTALLYFVAHLFENRQPASESLPFHIRVMLEPHRL